MKHFLFDMLFFVACLLLAIRLTHFWNSQDNDIERLPVNLFPYYSSIHGTAIDQQLMAHVPHFCSVSILRASLRFKDHRSGAHSDLTTAVPQIKWIFYNMVQQGHGEIRKKGGKYAFAGFNEASDIEDISVVRQMPNLEVCSVSVNAITTLEDFSHCSNLQELYIRNNKIEELWQICYLKDLDKLRILWLADNPCASGDNYRSTVLRNLPGLQKLDNMVVQDEERPKAEEEGELLSLPDSKKDNSALPTENGDATPDRISGKDNKDKELNMKDPVTLSWEETNKIREQLGLKPLPIDKMTTPKSAPTSATRHRNANILQAVLLLVKELDKDSLDIVDSAVKKRLDAL